MVRWCPLCPVLVVPAPVAQWSRRLLCYRRPVRFRRGKSSKWQPAHETAVPDIAHVFEENPACRWHSQTEPETFFDMTGLTGRFHRIHRSGPNHRKRQSPFLCYCECSSGNGFRYSSVVRRIARGSRKTIHNPIESSVFPDYEIRVAIEQ